MKEFMKTYPVPRDPVTREFYWGPGEYPNVKGKYLKWDSENPPLHADGVYYWEKGTDIDWVSADEFMDIKFGVLSV